MPKRTADACAAKAVEEGWKMNVAVVDAGADLVLFQRMDGAFLGSVEIAQMKARSSAMFPFPTRGLSEIAFGKDGEPGRTPGLGSCRVSQRSRAACRSRPRTARTSVRSESAAVLAMRTKHAPRRRSMRSPIS
jgi:hypothetical protein